MESVITSQPSANCTLKGWNYGFLSPYSVPSVFSHLIFPKA